MINLQIENEKLKRERDNYNLGDLIKDLEKYPADADICIRPFNLHPTGFCSYRGYYSDLSLEYTIENYDEKILNCGQLLEEAKKCVGKSFYGYKGGDFIMTEKSVIWLANYGRTTDAILTGVKDRFGNGTCLELTWKVVED
jgi:hypothetical protein